jgi:hypothetical protein
MIYFITGTYTGKEFHARLPSAIAVAFATAKALCERG